MAHAFLSYSRSDKAYVDKLAAFLKKQGIPVWYDTQVEPSDIWWDRIEQQLSSATVFIVIMSDHASSSKWVRRECHIADDNDLPTFPLLLSGKRWGLFADIQYESVMGNKMPSGTFIGRLREHFLQPLATPWLDDFNSSLIKPSGNPLLGNPRVGRWPDPVQREPITPQSSELDDDFGDDDFDLYSADDDFFSDEATPAKKNQRNFSDHTFDDEFSFEDDPFDSNDFGSSSWDNEEPSGGHSETFVMLASLMVGAMIIGAALLLAILI